MARSIKPAEKSDMKRFQDQLEQAAAAEGWRHYQCASVTPMYGGGVKAGEVDEAMPIRASAIRGQLRFWWRIACGPFADPQEMFRRETAIWGGIAETGPTASKVKVRVAGAPIDSTALCHSSSDSDTGIKYAFGPAAIKGGAKWLKPGYAFELSLSYAEAIQSEVETTLRWWASFGGMGSRTRRGFGAVRIEGVMPVMPDEVVAMGGKFGQAGSGGNNAEREWKKAIGKLYDFRQRGGIARNERKPTPGRSFWPEPDQIRRFSGKNANGKHVPEHKAGNVFPRAAFGLPIIFQFKGTSGGEPGDHTLLPAGDEDRMASPLILRPYWNGTHWQAAALLLPGWEKALSQPLKFKGQDYEPAHWPADSKSRQEKARHIQPMMKGSADDPLSAFMHYFENKVTG